MGNTFLVCVHNVSEEQPYVILRASVHSTAADIIRQVFMKVRRAHEDESNYAIVEECTDDTRSAANIPAGRQTAPRITRRVLRANENVWKAQSRWKNLGRFVLENRKETVHSTLEKVRAFIVQLEAAKQSMNSLP
ncbi:Ras association domain protein [Ostertagia ostertagi]